MLPITTDFALDALNLAAFSTSEDSKNILIKVLELYTAARNKKNQVGIDTDMDVFFDIIKDLVTVDATLDRKSERNKIILKVKTSPIAQKDQLLVDNLADMLKLGAEQGLSVQKEKLLIKKLQNWVLISATNDKLLDSLALCRKYSQSNETQNDLILMNMLDKASELTKIQDNIIGATESLDELDMSSKTSMLASANKYVQRRKTNIIHMGLQGINRMLGSNNGVAQGELVGIAASSHHGKSFTLLNIARWVTVLNTFELVTPGKVPTVLFITLENEVSDNWKDLSTAAYVNANHRPVPPNLTKEELVDINYAYYNQHGNKLIMRRFGEEFGFSDLIKLIAHLEMSGLEIKALILDYPALFRMEGDEKSNAAKDLERLFQKLRDLAHSRDIAIFTGIQLDSSAERLIASGEVCPVKKLGAAALADAKAIKRTLDVLIYQVIEVVDGASYLTMAWGKHRNDTSTKVEDKYCAYKFLDDTLGIMDDIGGQDISIKDIYATDNTQINKSQEDFFSQIKSL